MIPLLLFLALGSNLDAQKAAAWKTRDGAQRRINAAVGHHVPAALARLKSPSPAVRQAAERVATRYREWYADPLRGGVYPWLDMLLPSRFGGMAGEEPPAYFGLLDKELFDADQILTHYLGGRRDVKDDGPDWANYREATRAYCADLFRSGCTREQVVTMLVRMRQLEVVYMQKVWKK